MHSYWWEIYLHREPYLLYIQGENFCELVEKKDFRGLLPGAVKRCHAPKFCRENFHK